MRSLRIVGLVLATLFFAGVAFSESEDASAACPVTKPTETYLPARLQAQTCTGTALCGLASGLMAP